MKIRVAGAEDVATLAALRRTWAEEDADGPIDDVGFEEAFASWLADEGATRIFFIVEHDGVAVGMGNVKRYDRMPAPGRNRDLWGYVGNVYIRAEHRNGGVGSLLMDAMHEWAWAAGADKLRLSPMPRAVPFYERLGWRQSAILQVDR